MKIARVVLFFLVLALVAAPLGNAALAVWPFTSSTPTTTKKPAKLSAKSVKKQEPSMMQKFWNGVTSPFSSSKPAPKKPSKPIGFSATPAATDQKS